MLRRTMDTTVQRLHSLDPHQPSAHAGACVWIQCRVVILFSGSPFCYSGRERCRLKGHDRKREVSFIVVVEPGRHCYCNTNLVFKIQPSASNVHICEPIRMNTSSCEHHEDGVRTIFMKMVFAPSCSLDPWGQSDLLFITAEKFRMNIQREI